MVPVLTFYAAFTCQIDTGSSDLWVIPPDGQPVKTVNHTEVAVGVTYADESGVSGFIDFAELAVGGYTIPSQGTSCNTTTRIPDADSRLIASFHQPKYHKERRPATRWA